MRAICKFMHRVFIGVVLGSLAYGQAAVPKSESAYEMVMRLRREAAAKRAGVPAVEIQNVGALPLPSAAPTGPVVAKAELKLVPPIRGSPTGILGLRRYDATRVRPAALKEVPADAPREPAYFAIRVEDRDIPGVMYRSIRPPGEVVFWLDTDGDGLLSDEKGYLGVRLTILVLSMTYQFGPVYLRQGNTDPGGDVFYVQCTNGEWFTLWQAFYREGQLLLNGKTRRIALVDLDFDGRFNESFVPPAVDSRDPGCDVLALDLNGDSQFNYGKTGDSEVMPLSKLIKVDGNYYSMDVAQDGGTIELRQAKPAFGQLDLGNEEVVLGLWSDAGHQRLSSFGGKLSLPAGRYAVVSLDLTEKDAAGSRWTFDMRERAGAGQLGSFEVRPGATTSFKIGPPFQIRTAMKRFGNAPDVTVDFDYEGQGGERYSSAPKKDGKEPPEPGFKIVNSAGQVVQSGQFAYR